MRLAEALRIAEALRELLAPAAERIEIAGSIRRRKPEVKDIELVAIPRWAERAVPDAQGDLFAPPPVERVNLLRTTIEALEAADGRIRVIKPGTQDVVPWHLTTEGRYWRLYLPRPQLKVDLFVQTTDTWGLNYLIRTGSGVGPDGSASSGFAPAMLMRWKAITAGGYSREARLWRPAARTPEATPEEADVFAACRVAFVPPEERISASDVDRYALD